MSPSFIKIPSQKGYLYFDKVLTEKDGVSDDTVILIKTLSNENIEFKMCFPENMNMKILDSDIQYIQRKFFDFTQEQIRVLRKKPVHYSAWHFSVRQKQQEIPHQKNTSIFYCITGSEPIIESYKNRIIRLVLVHASDCNSSDGRKKPEIPHQEGTSTFYRFTGSEPVIKLIEDVCGESIKKCYLSYDTSKYENMDSELKTLGIRLVEMPNFIIFTVNDRVIKFETDKESEVLDFYKQGLTNKEILFNYLRFRGIPIADDYPLSDVRSGNDKVIEKDEIKLKNIRLLLKRLTSRLTESDRELSPGRAERLSRFASAYSAVTKKFDFFPYSVAEIRIHSLNDLRKLYKELDEWTIRVREQLNLAKFDTLFLRRTDLCLRCVSDILNFSAEQTEPEIPHQEGTSTFYRFTGSEPVIKLIEDVCGESIKKCYLSYDTSKYENMDSELKTLGIRLVEMPNFIIFTVNDRVIKFETDKESEVLDFYKQGLTNKEILFNYLRFRGIPIADDYPLSDVRSGNDKVIEKDEIKLKNIRLLLKRLTSRLTESDRELSPGRAERLSRFASAYSAVTKKFDFFPYSVAEIRIHSLNDLRKLYKELDEWTIRVREQLNLAKFDTLFLRRTDLCLRCVSDILNFSAEQTEPEMPHQEKTATFLFFTGSEPVIELIKAVCDDTPQINFRELTQYEVMDNDCKKTGGRFLFVPGSVTFEGRKFVFKDIIQKIKSNYHGLDNKEEFFRFLRDTGFQINDDYPLDDILSENDKEIGALEVILSLIRSLLEQLTSQITKSDPQLSPGRAERLSWIASACSAVTKAFDFFPACVTEIKIHSLNDMLKLYEKLDHWAVLVQEKLNLAKFDCLFLKRIGVRIVCVKKILDYSAEQTAPILRYQRKTDVFYGLTGSELIINFIKLVCGNTVKERYGDIGEYEALDKELKEAGGRYIMPPKRVTVKDRVIEFNDPEYPEIDKFWTSCAANPDQNNKELVFRFLKDTGTQIDDNYPLDLISSANDGFITAYEILLNRIMKSLDDLKFMLKQEQGRKLPSGNIQLLSRFASAFSALTEKFDFSPSSVTEITIDSFDGIFKLYKELNGWVESVQEQLNLAKFDDLYLKRIGLRVDCVLLILVKYKWAWSNLAYKP